VAGIILETRSWSGSEKSVKQEPEVIAVRR
jgi:hypothetical protein